MAEANNIITKNFTIIVLVFLLVLSLLGINLLNVAGRTLTEFSELLGPFIRQTVSFISYNAGKFINVGADVSSDIAKFGIDIADDTAHSVGNLLQNKDNKKFHVNDGVEKMLTLKIKCITLKIKCIIQEMSIDQ